MAPPTAPPAAPSWAGPQGDPAFDRVAWPQTPPTGPAPSGDAPSGGGGRHGHGGGGRGDGDGRRRPLPAALAGGLVGAVVAGLVAFGTVKVADDHNSPGTPAAASSARDVPVALANNSPSTITGEALDIHTLLAQVEPSVVSIEIGAQARNGSVQPVAAGSGVVISDDGLVLTNAHVVEVTDQFGRALANPVITVKLSDGSEREATVLGTSPANDIALVKVNDTSGLKAATLGDSDKLRVGDDVVAIGNALDLGDTPTVTKGIVSAKDRTLDVDANTSLEGLIQTDAPINHGNSGGALVNAAGEVIGINSAGIPDAQDVGFAIAINTIKPLIDQLKSGQTPATAQVAYLGVSTQQTPDGVTVTGVAAGSAADKAGLRAGDVIVGIDDTTISTTDELGSTLRGHKPGDTVQVKVERSGSTQTVTAQLGARNQ
jgi:putative serine protease PepD